MTNSYFNKISILLFYNQHNLKISDSHFTNSLCAIIYADNIDNQDEHISYQDTIFEQNLQIPETQKAISIIRCIFNNINSIKSESTKNVIKIDGPQHSLYITDTTFLNCTTESGSIYITTGRCVTITHTCCYNCIGTTDSSFLYFKNQDYLVYLYSSIQFNYQYNNAISSANSYCISGDQIYKCVNETDSPFIGFQYENPNYFYFKMITLLNTIDVVRTNRIIILGDKELIAPQREFEMVNIYSTVTGISRPFSILILASGTFVFTRCLFVDGYSGSFFDTDNTYKINVICKNCLYRQSITLTGTIINCASVSNSINTGFLTSYPYYTNQHCMGVGMDDKAVKYGCKNDECLDESNDCLNGFPSGVIPYTTIHHDEFQTRPFSKSSKFTQSSEFTKTNFFTGSFEFSISNHFSNSNLFTFSNDFSQSKIFSESIEFSESIGFSNSDEFSNSFYFSVSNKFTQTDSFSMSTKFSNSKKFSFSNFFSFSKEFSKSKIFTKTFQFSKSDLFTIFEEFSTSKKLSNSAIFTESKFFSQTIKFSDSLLFTFSKKFAQSKIFSISNIFSKSIKYTQSAISKDLIIFTESHSSQKVTFSMSYILTNVIRRSVSFSLSYSSSNSVLYTYVNGEYSAFYTLSDYQFYFPYIINISPTSYAITYIPFLVSKKEGLTGEQIIAISCGSASVFFFVIGVIVLLVKKKKDEKSKLYYEFDSSSDNNDGYQSENVITKETRLSFSAKSSSDGESDLDFWL